MAREPFSLAAVAGEGAKLPQLEELPLDLVTLQELSGGDDSESGALLRDFLDTTVHDVAVLAQAREKGDLSALARQAHKIKGAARLIGAGELAQAAAELEDAGHAGEWTGILPLVANVQTATERLKLFVAARYGATS